MRLANSVAVKQQMDCSFSDSSHRWFSRWILLGSYSLGGNISCWFWQAGQLQQRQYPCFAFPCTCPVFPQTGSAGTMLSATALPSLCTSYMPHSSRFSLSLSGRKKFATSGFTTSFLPLSQVTNAVPWETKMSTDCDDFYLQKFCQPGWHFWQSITSPMDETSSYFHCEGLDSQTVYDH